MYIRVEDKKQILKWYIKNKLSFDSIGKAFKDNDNLKDGISIKQLEEIVKHEKYAHVQACETCVHGNTDYYKGIRCVDECIKSDNYNYWSFPYGAWSKVIKHSQKFA